jgi:hypothetical protein
MSSKLAKGNGKILAYLCKLLRNLLPFNLFITFGDLLGEGHNLAIISHI